MVRPLAFKGDKKVKKRKRTEPSEPIDSTDPLTSSTSLTTKPSSTPVDQPIDDDSWVSADTITDITGPVLLVLPTTPHSSLACDANGSIFTSALENVVDADPRTAEPHDVRQVWVATRIAGSESVNLKAHTGRYLGCDGYGILSAVREAVGEEEGFVFVEGEGAEAGLFGLRTERGRFLTVVEGKKGDEVRGDADGLEFNAMWRVRMQAKFKPKLVKNKEDKAREKISRRELEDAVGRRLEDEEVRRLKRARRDGNYHEAILDARVKNKHDKYS